MPSILAIADIHAEVENLLKFLKIVKKTENFDFIVCPGDFVDVQVSNITLEEVAEIILEELNLLNKPVITVPGNQDAEILDILKEKSYCVHGKGIKFNDIGFFGYGGARTPFKTSLEPSENELLLGISKSYKEIENAKIKVLVVHMPPLHTKLDLLPYGIHVGSRVIRDFILQNQPSIAISAHLHEASGIDELGKTKIVNPGRFTEGKYAIIKIENGKVEIKLKNLFEKNKLKVEDFVES